MPGVRESVAAGERLGNVAPEKMSVLVLTWLGRSCRMAWRPSATERSTSLRVDPAEVSLSDVLPCGGRLRRGRCSPRLHPCVGSIPRPPRSHPEQPQSFVSVHCSGSPREASPQVGRLIMAGPRGPTGPSLGSPRSRREIAGADGAELAVQHGTYGRLNSSIPPAGEVITSRLLVGAAWVDATAPIVTPSWPASSSSSARGE